MFHSCYLTTHLFCFSIFCLDSFDKFFSGSFSFLMKSERVPCGSGSASCSNRKVQAFFNKKSYQTNFDNQLTTLPHSKTRHENQFFQSFSTSNSQSGKEKKSPYVLIWLAKKKVTTLQMHTMHCGSNKVRRGSWPPQVSFVSRLLPPTEWPWP